MGWINKDSIIANINLGGDRVFDEDPMLEAGKRATMGSRYKVRPPDYFDLHKMILEGGGDFVLDRSSWEHPSNKEKFSQWMETMDKPMTNYETLGDIVKMLNEINPNKDRKWMVGDESNPDRLQRLNLDVTLRDLIERSRTSMEDVYPKPRKTHPFESSDPMNPIMRREREDEFGGGGL